MDRDVVVLDRLPDLGRLIAGAAARGLADLLARSVRPHRLPDRTIVLPDLAPDPGRLAAYDRVCGLPLTDAVAPTWLHVLTFPLQAALLAAPDFPLPFAGLVHLANDMTLHRPVRLTDRLRLQVSAEGLAEHRRGQQFDLVGEVHVGDELVWTGRSTYLARGLGPGAAPQTREAHDAADVAGQPAPPPSQLWRLPADLGRRYARVSGDVNPIHLSPLTARAFGFRRPIAHGLWTHARALAALGGRLPPTYGVSVSFTRPVLLPATVAFGVERTASGWRFAVTDAAATRPHLLGEVRG